jgi:hypothetical protein
MLNELIEGKDSSHARETGDSLVGFANAFHRLYVSFHSIQENSVLLISHPGNKH